jgi:lipopolysaccharide transport system permease protein
MLGFNRYDVRLGLNLLKMTLRDRYLGSGLGGLWAIANPLILLALYTYIFGFVFKTKLPGAETTLSYVVWLISGYGPWIATSDALMAATVSVTGASGLVKNMAFKTELLPIANTFIGSISLSVTLLFLPILIVASGTALSWHILLLPLIVLVHFSLLIALGIWLSAINVFIRDTTQIMPTLLMIWLFMSPIFYSYESMPLIIQKITFLNPIYIITSSYRDVLNGNRFPSFLGLLYVEFISVIVFYYGLKAFRRVKGNFDGVL